MTLRNATGNPDPRLSKDADLFYYEPRTEDAPAHYDRDEIVEDLTSFYKFLPHVSTSSVNTAPLGGWPEITKESLAKHGINKSPGALDLMRHLPYISSDEPWIMITAFVCDYRRVAVPSEATILEGRPRWFSNAADKQWPPWTVMLTAGTDREASVYILDTTDGTITRYCAGDCGPYPPTYAYDDPRTWRDHIDMETVTVKEWLGHWKKKYIEGTVLTIPPDDGGYGSHDPFSGEIDEKPGSYNYEVLDSLRKIYRDYGWPDIDSYRKEDCIAELKSWYKDYQARVSDQMKIETRLHWEKQGITLTE